MSSPDLESVASAFGKAVKSKLTSPAARGEPEDQLRGPLETLIPKLAEIGGLAGGAVTLVGESTLSALQTRPDFAVSMRDALVGFIEVKRPGAGADPRSFKGHDKEQWEKLRSLPNLMYTDGNQWSLWRNGELDGDIVRAEGDVRSSGARLAFPPALVALLNTFLLWKPIPPKSARELATLTARLCRLLRAEVAEQLAAEDPALTELAKEWRRLLFPEATGEVFADGYAQAVTFGLLMARVRRIKLSDGIEGAASKLRKTDSLIGAALRLLTDDAENQRSLRTSLQTLTRVLDVVSWKQISDDEEAAWLYFYEDFLAEYDNDLRKRTGSYYTPPAVVESMVRLVDEALVSRFKEPNGLASERVTIADPAVGTGTFALGVLRRIAQRVEEDQGAGARKAAIEAAIRRLIAFEIQLGPFAVAQLRLAGDLQKLMGSVPKQPLRMFVTDTLANPFVEHEDISALTRAISESRRQANEIKKSEGITVVIGNPPYKEKAKGRGGWIEEGGIDNPAPLNAWKPPAEWGVGAHAKHLRNLYVYFWRWATWKVFDQRRAGPSSGIVCFITVAGFLNGPGFQKMRDYLRRTADEIWVIDCSPEGHQPPVASRVFQGVQQPVCIVLASRAKVPDPDRPAKVRFRKLPEGAREGKFDALQGIGLSGRGWTLCPDGFRDPFLPESEGAWSTFAPIEDLFLYNGSGVMPGRVWVIAPDPDSLRLRWEALIHASSEDKAALFHPHLRNGKPGDKHIEKVVKQDLGPHPTPRRSMMHETGGAPEPIAYALRSLDRQFLIPDARILNQPNPTLWSTHSKQQIYLTVPTQSGPSNGPGVTFTSLIPDLHHYNGRGGRVMPLWGDAEASQPNVSPGLLDLWSDALRVKVRAEDVIAYIGAIAAHPTFTTRFRDDLTTPGIRIPLTTDAKLFQRSVEIGREVVWLHTFGERFADASQGRPASPPRLPREDSPRVPSDGAIPDDPDGFPDEIGYDEATGTLRVGAGRVERVPPGVWLYEVSGKRVLTQWFNYRRKTRERPIIGDRRQPSALGEIQPEAWPAAYTTEMLNVIHVLGRLVRLEPLQAELLDAVVDAERLGQDAIDRIHAANQVELAERRTGETLFGGSI
ncbi:MAG: type ISP restriction/modification enzyme [Phycisphaerales bacterium]